MESLLRWSIENAAVTHGSEPKPPPPNVLDPGIIDAILGKPDAVHMKVSGFVRSLLKCIDYSRKHSQRDWIVLLT